MGDCPAGPCSRFIQRGHIQVLPHLWPLVSFFQLAPFPLATNQVACYEALERKSELCPPAPVENGGESGRSIDQCWHSERRIVPLTRSRGISSALDFPLKLKEQVSSNSDPGIRATSLQLPYLKSPERRFRRDACSEVFCKNWIR